MSLLESGERRYIKAINNNIVSRFGLAVRRSAGKQKDLGSNPLRLSFLFSSKVVVCLVTLSLTVMKH